MSIVDTSKSFDIIDGETVKSVTVQNLTLKQKDKLYAETEEIVKESKRKEFLAMSKLMEGKERMKFLVEASQSNKPTVAEIIEESQSVNGISRTLALVASPKMDWEKILSTEEAVEGVLKCYYWALNIDIHDLPEDESKEEKADFFPLPHLDEVK